MTRGCPWLIRNSVRGNYPYGSRAAQPLVVFKSAVCDVTSEQNAEFVIRVSEIERDVLI